MTSTHEATFAGQASTSTGTADRTIAVVVNGSARVVPAGWTIADLLRAHDLDPRLVVVERNREILRDRDAFGRMPLESDDVLELVHFVGGG